MRFIHVISLACLATIACRQAASQTLPSVRTGAPYGQVRQALIQAGNIPADLRRNGRCVDLNRDVCEAYPEMESCAVDGRRPCNFRWTTPGHLSFIVTTTGEHRSSMKVEAVTAR